MASAASACIARSARTSWSSPIRWCGRPAERAAFLDALFAFAGELDRRPVFYQISLDWIPVLHDRGYDFFKLGEEAHVPLDRVTLEGHAGKMYRQILRRGRARRRARSAMLAPDEVAAAPRRTARRSPTTGCSTKELAERQFSIGFFDRRLHARGSRARSSRRPSAGRAGSWRSPTCSKARTARNCRST